MKTRILIIIVILLVSISYVYFEYNQENKNSGWTPVHDELHQMCKETGQGNMWNPKESECMNVSTPFGKVETIP